jgi:hypothetical protein
LETFGIAITHAMLLPTWLDYKRESRTPTNNFIIDITKTFLISNITKT